MKTDKPVIAVVTALANGYAEKELLDVVEMKKQHPCGTNAWKVIRLGADIRIKCEGCGHSVLIPRREFEKKMKKVLKKASE